MGFLWSVGRWVVQYRKWHCGRFYWLWFIEVFVRGIILNCWIVSTPGDFGNLIKIRVRTPFMMLLLGLLLDFEINNNH